MLHFYQKALCTPYFSNFSSEFNNQKLTRMEMPYISDFCGRSLLWYSHSFCYLCLPKKCFCQNCFEKTHIHYVESIKNFSGSSKEKAKQYPQDNCGKFCPTGKRKFLTPAMAANNSQGGLPDVINSKPCLCQWTMPVPMDHA